MPSISASGLVSDLSLSSRYASGVRLWAVYPGGPSRLPIEQSVAAGRCPLARHSHTQTAQLVTVPSHPDLPKREPSELPDRPDRHRQLRRRLCIIHHRRAPLLCRSRSASSFPSCSAYVAQPSSLLLASIFDHHIQTSVTNPSSIASLDAFGASAPRRLSCRCSWPCPAAPLTAKGTLSALGSLAGLLSTLGACCFKPHLVLVAP